MGIDTEHGLPTLLASIVIVLSLHFLLRLGEFIWKQYEKRGQLSETSIRDLTNALNKNTAEMDRLACRIEKVEQHLVDIPKLKLDLRRLFSAVKIISGDEWQNVRKKIMEEEL